MSLVLTGWGADFFASINFLRGWHSYSTWTTADTAPECHLVGWHGILRVAGMEARANVRTDSVPNTAILEASCHSWMEASCGGSQGWRPTGGLWGSVESTGEARIAQLKSQWWPRQEHSQREIEQFDFSELWFIFRTVCWPDCSLVNSLLDERLSVHSAHRAVSLFPHGGWCACKPTVWDRSGGEAWHAVGSQYRMAIKKGSVHLGWLYYYLINWKLFKGLGFGGELSVVYSKSLFYFPVLIFPSRELSILCSKSRSQFPVCILPFILAESRKSYMLRKVVGNNPIVPYVCLFSILFRLVCTCGSYDGTRKRQGDGRNSGKPLRFDQSQEKLF